MQTTSLPTLALLMGDSAGIGPEMMARLLALPENRAAANLLLIGDACVWKDGQAIAGVDVPTHTITELADYVPRPGSVTLWDLDTLGGKFPLRGQSTVEAGTASFIAMEKAIDAVSAGVAQAIVFAPLNKHSLRIGGLEAEDELRHMQQRFGVQSFVCEFNIAERLWTSRVTSHVPVREIADHIDQQGVEDAIAIIWGALRQAGIESPRVAVCGLNPHAGDGGSIGREEIDIIAPAVQAAQRSGKQALGPFPSDTVFIAAQRGDFDAVVCMYHDQGQIAMKLMGFDKGVTLHGGLPVPVATSASGSAFDIAGKGLAKIHGLQRAFDLCVRMGAAVPKKAITRTEAIA